MCIRDRLKAELAALGSQVYAAGLRHAVPAGGALAVERAAFSADVTALLEAHPLVRFERAEVANVAEAAASADAVVVAAGPLATDALAASLARLTGRDHLAFFDAAAPIVMADSLDRSKEMCIRDRTFTVRKISFSIGVERTFPVHSPKIDKIEVVRHGDVRRAKLYYLRDKVGKAAKIKEKSYR